MSSPSVALLTAQSSSASTSKSKIPLGLSVFLESVHDVDTAKEIATVCFSTTFFIRAQSKEEAMTAIDSYATHIALVGAQGEETVKDSGEWDDVDLLPGCFAKEYQISATIKVSMQYDHFPFDIQDVPLKLYVPELEVEIISSESFWPASSTHILRNVLVCCPSALVSEEWQMHAPIIEYGVSDPLESLDAYPQVSITLKLARRGEGYAVRIMSLMAVMSLTGLLPFIAQPLMETGDALAFEVGLLFAVIAFQLMISAYLPVCPTLTILDIYGMFLFFFVSGCMGLLTISSIRVAPRIAIATEEEAEEIKSSASNLDCKTMVGAWLVFHFIFACRLAQVLAQRAAKFLLPHAQARGAFVIEGGQSVGRAIGLSSASALAE